MENKNKIEATENVGSNIQEEGSSFDFRTIFTMFILNWQWFALSVFIFLCGAFIYLRYKSPVYQVSAKILIKDDNNKSPGGGGSDMLSNMQDLGFMSNSNGIDNEIEILNSHLLAREAVRDLKLYVSYKQEGSLKDQLIYKTQPINVDIDPSSLNKMDDRNKLVRVQAVKMKIEKDGNKYNVTGIVYTNLKEDEERPFEVSFSSLPAVVKTYAGVLTFTRNRGELLPSTEDKTIYATILPPSQVAAGYIKGMTVEPTSKTTSIALLTIQDQNRQRAEEFLKQLAVCYNRQANADKNEIAVKTEEFINGRLEKINNELGSTEGELENYKRRNSLTQLKLDATETLTQSSEYSTKLSEAKSQIELLDYLREYIDAPGNKYQIIPSNVGLVDVASTTLIKEFNQNVLDRNRMLHTASEIAPQVQTLTSTLDELQRSIRTALLQARRSADITRQGIESQYSLYQNKIANAPEQERILTQIGRQQEVKSGLYLMLLQKREENSISLAATADKGKMIDDPIYGGKVSPQSSIILMVAFVLGLGIPMLIIYILQLLHYKIENHDEVARLTNLPIIADVAVASESAKTAAGIVVHENQNDQIDEIFRSMRTNVQFMLKGNQKVIMFTSSTSGEGKTFNAANLSVSFALLGKKVVLIGLDIRKPALGRLFGIPDREKGITPLLTKDVVTMEDINKQICPSEVNKNLDLILAGSTPPNPTELLARPNLGEIINLLKEKYDYVILDTAPIGLVTDTLQISKLADVSLIICRADYTPKTSFGLINSLAAEKKLPNMCIVINGIDMSKKKNGYYYGYGKYGKYGHYGHYGNYGSYGSYGDYANSHYGKKGDNSIKK